MLIRRMTAVFGKLQGQTLELKDGLNIIQAPNETGKSTWCAFILAMFYGINSRERDKAGIPADKTRYAPWSGAAMSGKLDCLADGQEITLLRTTRRASAPMGEFQAFYTNTADTVPNLTAALCGEQLLGISREVYARSAFIRQNNIGITQNVELERRIASLISSGEESTSYSEAVDLLKKQLNQRRHNHTGRVPTLEAELQQLQKQATEAEELSHRLFLLHQQEQALVQQSLALQQELDCFAAQEENQTRLLSDAKAAADHALRHADMLRQQLEADRIPESDTIARLRGAIVNLGTSHRALEKAREARDEAMKDFLRAEAAVTKSPFAGQSSEQVKKFLDDAVSSAPSTKSLVVLIALGITVIALSITDLLHLGKLSYIGIPVGLIAIIEPFFRRHKYKRTLNATLQKHGVSSLEALHVLASDYATSLATRDTAQENLSKCSEYADTLYNSISSNEQAILLEIRRFAPSAHDLSTADALLRGCAIRRKELAAAEQVARDALSRQDATTHTVYTERAQTTQSTGNQLQTEAELAHITGTLNTCRTTIHQLTGQLSAVGDVAQLHTNIEATEQQLETLQNEYASLQLALTALDSANQTLQNRFSPALGRRTAQLFKHLTQGQYQHVALDRNFHLAAEPSEDHIYRDVSLLSAGAADQLYLAARLAISETVLPPEKNAPLILDDALANFDDERCAAALRLLKEISQHRQILLFTCHSREAAFFSEDKEVTILQLTNRAEKV